MDERRDDDVLTTREVAMMLRVHTYTVTDLLKSKRLEGFKLRHRWRIKRSSVLKLMNSKEK